jgi:D-alanine-D-alanine ligase
MENKEGKALRVGVLFGGRSGEHEVSLASARNVMEALTAAGHDVIPIGITLQGRWLPYGDPLGSLTAAAQGAATMGAAIEDGSSSNGAQSLESAHSGSEGVASGNVDLWALLPKAARDDALPTLDILFPVLHGPFGEDGTVQGMLEMANIPYVGCGVLASAVCMDKGLARRLFAAAGLPIAESRELLRSVWHATPEEVLDGLETALGYPMFVKPANLGSSVGISKARTRDQLVKALDHAARFDRKLVIERAVPNAREIEVSVLGNDDPEASVPGEIIPGAEFYDYAAKYLDDCSELLIPAPLDEETTARVRELAVRAFKAADCSGLARVDFLLDGESGELFLNEINTMPGFTRISMYPKLWEASGVPYPELVDRLVRLGFARHQDREQNETGRE